MNSARPAEIGRLSAIDGIGPQFDRFMKDHKHRISTSRTEMIVAGLAVMLILVIVSFF